MKRYISKQEGRKKGRPVKTFLFRYIMTFNVECEYKVNLTFIYIKLNPRDD